MPWNCENCIFRQYAERQSGSWLGRVWRWHTRWCPRWRAYQRGYQESRKGGEAS